METKRLLKWEAAIDGIGKPCLRAQTKLVTCDVYDDHSWCVYDIEGGEADSQEAALDACEAAYIKLCTEFLSLYNPSTHVVVSRGAGKAASETIERCLGDGFREYFDCDELDSNNNALAELRAALEGKND